jgi:electron transport complex protein RnfG
VLTLLGLAREVSSEVFHSRKEGVALAFPDADRVLERTIILTAAQAEQIEALAKSKLPSKLLRLYTGERGGRVVGYAFVDTHEVRSRQEALLIVLDPLGNLRSLRVLAFHEPLDYLPVARWFEQFAGKSSDDELRPGRDIHGVVGATLSTRAITDAARRALAFYSVVIAKGDRG